MRAIIRSILFACITLVAAANLSSAADRWRVITDIRSVRDMLSFDHRIWCATSGGLEEYDPSQDTYTQISLTEGLAGVGLNRLAPDSDGGFWIVYENRFMQRYQPDAGVTHTVSKLAETTEITQIRHLFVGKSALYVGTNKGVAQITYTPHIDRWVWRSNFTRLGDFPTDTPVNSVYADDRWLWVATSLGIARGDLNSPDPLTWTNYTTAEGLPSNGVYSLQMFHGQLLASTTSGVVVWSGTGWSPFSPNKDIFRMYIIRDSLRALVNGGIGTWDGARWKITYRPNVVAMTWDDQARLWVGYSSTNVSLGGIGVLDQGTWNDIPFSSPCTNIVDAFDVAANGDLLMAGGRSQGQYGLSRWNGSRWKIWTMPQNGEAVFTSPQRAIIEDYLGGVWIGTGSKGVVRFNPDGTLTQYNDDDSTGGRLRHHDRYATMTIIPGITDDDFGNLWVINYGAVDGNTLVCIPADFIKNPSPDKQWYYFHRTLFKSFPYFTKITHDARGRIWLASDATDASQPQMGVYVFDPNGTPGNPDDDRVYGPLAGLGNAQVFSLTYDPAGYVWAGSLDGAYYINADAGDPSTQQFSQLDPLRNVQVNDIEIDPQDNKWIGTTFGVTVVDPDLYTVRRTITTDFPDLLPASNVRVIKIDTQTGWAYFGTENGTVALFTPYRNYGDKLTSVTVEPNPFNPNAGRLFFTGTSLAKRAGVKIFTPDGRLVRELSYEEAALGWDGMTANNKRTADGVYLIVAFTDDGQAARGKVALIWK